MKKMLGTVLFALALGSFPAHACKVMIDRGAVQVAQDIIVGYPTSVQKLSNDPAGPIRYAFHVTQTLKGRLSGDVFVTEPHAGCYGFRTLDKLPGQYLLFLQKARNGDHTFGHPFPNRLLSNNRKEAKKAISAVVLAIQQNP